MRFYDIRITDIGGNTVSIGSNYMQFNSHKTNINGIAVLMNPGALNIEMDIPIVTCDIPNGDAYVKIWGVPLAVVNQVRSLAYANITISAGMQRGLPLANLQVANAGDTPRNGIIFKGSILQAFGNWQGTEQTIDLIVSAQLGQPTVSMPTPTKKKLIVIDAKTGSPLSSAVQNALQNIGISCTLNISPKLVVTDDMKGYYPDITSFSQMLNNASIALLNDSKYLGVKLIKTDSGYACSDNTIPSISIKTILFTDLIGQPTWLNIITVQLKLVMRSDIQVGDTLSMDMKKMSFIGNAKTQNALQSQISFNGTGWVSSVRHIGNYKQGDANSWISVVNLIMNTVAV